MKFEFPSAFYPGSFDPFTKAHLDITLTAMKMFASLTVVIASNPEKKCWFTPQERMDMINEVICDSDLKVVALENEYVPLSLPAKNSRFVVRGLRSSPDLEYETKLMRLYQTLNPGLQPIYIPSFPIQNMDLISSSMVKSLVGPKDWEKWIYPYLPRIVHAKFVERAKILRGQS